jgi:signal transduction histidine kinase
VVGINDYDPASTNLVDAEVVVIGVAAGIFSHQRQLLSPVVVLDSDEDLQVISPPQPLEAIPRMTVDSLFRYSPEGFPERRVRIQGKLLGQQPGRWMAVNDGTSGLFVESQVSPVVQPGAQLDLIGFPQMRDQTLWLLNAEVEAVVPGPPPPILDTTATEALAQPTSLVRLKGQLVSPPLPGEGVWVLSLRDADSEFEAWLPASGSGHSSEWREGAMLRIAGIAEPYVLPTHRLTMFPFPRGLRLHARSMDDIEVVRSAPWWTSPKLTRTIIISLIGALILLGFVSLLAAALARKNVALREARRRLRAAQQELAKRFSVRTGEWQEELAARHAAEADFALLTAERTRLARELHDTLEQSLASVALHLDAAKGYLREAPGQAEQLIEAATEQLRDGQADVRRSVWDLRSVKLEEATLPEALKQLGDALADPNGPAVDVRCEGPPTTISPGLASHLFRVAQEGVTNALKYANPENITILLRFNETSVELVITDDGCGFEVGSISDDGHYGLRGLRERAAAVGASLKIISRSGEGTRIEFIVPGSQAGKVLQHA